MPKPHEQMGYSLLTHQPFCLNVQHLKISKNSEHPFSLETIPRGFTRTLTGWISLAVGASLMTAWAWLKF